MTGLGIRGTELSQSATRESVIIRTLFQFCHDITELPQCAADSQAATVTTQTIRTQSTSKAVPPITTTQTTVLAACNCPPNHYWKLHEHTEHEFENGTSYNSTVYKCIKVI
jgi:hypothetical protein